MQTKILNVHLLLGFLICFVILIGLFTINHISKLMLEKNNVVQQLKVREDQLRLQLDNMNIAQRQLAQSESQFRQLAENIEHVLWLASIDKIIYVSPSIEKVFGLKQEDIYLDGTVFMKNIFYEDKESIKNAFQNANINHLDINEEYRILHPEKGLRWIWVRTFNLKNVGFEESKVVGIAQDITDRKIFEEQMLVSLDREMELNKLKSNIVSLVSHQFRTPLTTIKSSIQILASYTDQIQENIRARFQKHFFQITGEIDRLNSMVDTSIIISKIEAGKFPIRKSPTDIIKLTEQILIDNFETLNKDRPVKISHNGKPKLVELDERLITHILMNLISNAFKYSKGNPEINILFENDRLELEVKDDGIGIPLVEQNNLFEYFFRASNVAMHMGTGLGLIVVKEFMDLHNGIIEVKSEQNKGTSMRLIFPTVTKCIKY